MKDEESELTREDDEDLHDREEKAMVIADHHDFANEFGQLAVAIEKKFGPDNTLTPKVKQVAAIMQSMTDQEILDFVAAGEDLPLMTKTE